MNERTFTTAELTTRDAHRDEVVESMLSGTWASAGSRRAAAERWGCKLSRVMEIEREAAGAVRAARRDGWAEYIEVRLAELDAAKDMALAAKDLAVFVQAIKVQLQVAGALVPANHRRFQAQTSGDGEYEKMAPAEKRALLEQALSDLDAEARQGAH